MGEVVWCAAIIVLASGFNAWCYVRVRRAQLRLLYSRKDAIRAHMIRLASLDAHREKLLQRQQALDPIESVERYAARLRDANEVHRMREQALIRIADVAKVVCNGALVSTDRSYPTAHVKPLDLEALKRALREWGSTVIAPGAVEKTNNLSGPSDEGELPEAG